MENVPFRASNVLARTPPGGSEEETQRSKRCRSDWSGDMAPGKDISWSDELDMEKEEENISQGVLEAIAIINKETDSGGASGKLQFNKANQLAVRGACDKLYREFVDLLIRIGRLERNLGRERTRNVELAAEQRISMLEDREKILLLEKELEREQSRRVELEREKAKEVERRVDELKARLTIPEVTREGPGINSAGRQQTYAQVAVKGRNEVKEKKAIIIKSKVEGVTHDDIKRKLVERLPLEELGGGFKVVRGTKKGNLLIEPQSGEQRGKLQQVINRMDSMETVDPKGRRPAVRLTGVDKGHDGITLKKAIWDQNRKIREKVTEKEFEEHMKFVSNKSCRDDRKENWIAAVNGNIWKVLMEECQGRVYVDLVSIYVEEAINILKCYKCCGYGHISSKCTEKECCPRCGGEHRRNSCQVNILDCPNCKRLGLKPREHSADDPNCPAHQRRMVVEKSYIDYA